MDLEKALKAYLTEGEYPIAKEVITAELRFELDRSWDPTYGNGELELNHYIEWTGERANGLPRFMNRTDVNYHEMLEFLLNFKEEDEN